VPATSERSHNPPYHRRQPRRYDDC
jgi:hypothetical protein